mgnify:CR=1 FL=1
MMNRTSNHILEMQFKPLTRKADQLITEVQNTAFEVGYNQGIDDLVTYLHKKGIAMPLEIKGLKGSAVSQIIEKEY